MTMMKFISATVTLTLIQIALNYCKDFASPKAKIELGKLLFARQLPAMIAKWRS